MTGFQIVRSIPELRSMVHVWRRDGLKVALVPTMGALHEGHLTLTDIARQKADRVMASVFVNPTQFGPNEDFSAYPRQEMQDAALLAERKVDVLYAPTVQEMYQPGFDSKVKVGALTEPLCGVFRPGHFDGVATVVSKLLIQTLPDIALFGEKDYQQLLVIKRLALDLDIPVEILGVPTVRESDGLALSSRNKYLSAQERAAAPILIQQLLHIAEIARQLQPLETILADSRQKILAAGFSSVDYLEVRDAFDLSSVHQLAPGQSARVFVAARIGKARLIDNLAI